MVVPKLSAVVSGLSSKSAPTLVLGAALGATHAIWDGALAALDSKFAVIRFDLPGHGVSEVASDGFTIDELADGVIEMVNRHDVTQFYYAGVSIGGALALVLARRYPQRLLGVGVVCSAPTFGGASSGFRERAASVREHGMGFVTPNIAERWFSPTFRAEHPEVVDRTVNMVGAAKTEGYAQCCEALVSFDERASLARIDIPVVVISGGQDPGSTPAAGAEISDGVPGANQVVIPQTSHMAVVENPSAVSDALLAKFR